MMLENGGGITLKRSFVVVWLWWGSLLPAFTACGQTTIAIVPPAAAIKPTVLATHGIRRIDNDFWLRDRDNPEVVQYLRAENEYLRHCLAPAKDLAKKLFAELKGREKPSEATVPEPQGGWWYYSRMEDGQQYRIHCRAASAEDERHAAGDADQHVGRARWSVRSL